VRPITSAEGQPLALSDRMRFRYDAEIADYEYTSTKEAPLAGLAGFCLTPVISRRATTGAAEA